MRAMTCTLGRASLPSPDFITQDGGGRLRVGHRAGYPLSTALGQVLAQQVTGYPNPDEEVVRFIYDATLSGGVLDGFYFVASTSVNWVKLAAGLFAWEAELIPVRDSAAPLFTINCLGTDRPNSHTISGTSWVAFPGSALSFDVLDSPAALSLVGGGTVQLGQAATAYYSAQVNYGLTPTNAYQGAPSLTQNGAEVTGQAVLNDTDGWVLSNGLVKVRPSLTEANHLVVGVRNAGVTDYDEKAYRLGVRLAGANYELGRDGSTRYGPSAVSVLQLSPECIAIRLTVEIGVYSTLAGVSTGTVRGHGYLDITLRRGQGYVEFLLTSFGGTTPASYQWGVWRSTAETSVDITSGVEASAADSPAGNKYRIYTPRANSVDTTNGGVYIDSASRTFPFAIGNNRTMVPGGVVAQYFAMVEHTQEIVGR